MEKKVNIRLPKGKEAKNVQFNVVDGKIEVSYNLEDKVEPKDGDFIITSQGNIFIYNGNQSNISYGAYIGVMNMTKRITTGKSNNSWTLKNGCRYATEQEKSAFLERLEKEYKKKWNAERKCLEDVYVPKLGDIVKVCSDNEYPETKQIEDIRWRAKEGENYWYIHETAVLKETERETNINNDLRYMRNNYFRTPEAAQKVAEQIKEIFKNSKAE